MSPAHEYVAQVDQEALRLHTDAKRALEMNAYLRGQFEFLGSTLGSGLRQIEPTLRTKPNQRWLISIELNP